MEKEKTTLSEDTAAAPMPISDTVVRALADSLAKIEEYVPTNYVDDEEPYLEAANLNKSEQAIMRVTQLMNSAVDVIKGLEGQALKKSDLVNNALTTNPGVAALDAAMGKTLGDQVTALNSDLTKKLPYYQYNNSRVVTKVEQEGNGETASFIVDRPDGTIQMLSFYADGAVTVGKKTANGKWTNKYLANPGFDQDTFEGRIIATQSPSGQYGMRLYSGDDGWLWVDAYSSSVTEGITRRLQWNCLPNQPYLQFIEIDNATGQVKYLKDFMARKAEYWSGVESVTTIADQWIQGTRKIAVPPGQYMIVAHGKLPFSQPNSVCVHVRNDNNNMALQSYYTAIKCPDEMDTQFTYSFFQYLPTTDNLWLEFLSRGPVTVIETEISAIRLD